MIMAASVLVSCATRTGTRSDSPTEQLYARLSAHVDAGEKLYGHQDDLSYGHSWVVTNWENDPLERSDVKEVSGHYPAIVGFDLGGIELDDSCNLDGVPFGLMRKAAVTHSGRGGIVTLSWHPRNPLTGGDAWDVSSDEVVKSVLEGGPLHEKFMVWLDRAADFIASLGDAPVIFRPWHENLGSWFWWGGKLCSEEEYKALFRLTWSRLSQDKGLDNILWCYSPNGPISADDYLSRYPGDDVVDILGTDIYEYVGPDGLGEAGSRYVSQVRDMLAVLQAISNEHSKLMCLSETGLEGIPDSGWWCDRLYRAVEGFPVSYMLTWRNAHDKPGHFYAPWKGSGNEDDFIRFTEKKDIVLL